MNTEQKAREWLAGVVIHHGVTPKSVEIITALLAERQALFAELSEIIDVNRVGLGGSVEVGVLDTFYVKHHWEQNNE